MSDASLDEFSKAMQSGATQFCRCWMVTRRDGVTFGFTDHDRDLSFDGVQFSANSGLDASVIESSIGLSVDNAQALGALSADTITEDDIRAGKYDGAEVAHWLVNWKDVDVRKLKFRGTLGEIRRGDQSFEAELRGLAETLNQPLGRSYLKVCDRVLGDSKCGVDVDDPEFSITTVLVENDEGHRMVFEGLESYPDAWFDSGFIRWADGGLSVIKADSYSEGQRVLALWEEVRRNLPAGTEAQVIAGCDKRAETCKSKFDNFLNFRGFPHMPGEDFVTSYPSSGETHDGGSRFADIYVVDNLSGFGGGNA